MKKLTIVAVFSAVLLMVWCPRPISVSPVPVATLTGMRRGRVVKVLKVFSSHGSIRQFPLLEPEMVFAQGYNGLNYSYGSLNGLNFGKIWPVDLIVHMNTGTVGNTLTTTNLAAGTDTTSVLAGTPWVIAGTPASGFTIGTASPTNISSFKVNSNSDTYAPSYAFKSMALVNADPNLTWQITFAQNTATMTCAGWIGPAAPSSGTTLELFDQFVLEPTSGGRYAVAQLITGGSSGSPCGASGYGYEIETNPGGTTTHSACTTTPSAGNYYWVSLKLATATGATELYVFNSVGAQVGHLTATTDAETTTLYGLLIGNNESGTATGTTNFQSVVCDWTNAASPLGP